MALREDIHDGQISQEDMDNLWFVEENLSHNDNWLYTSRAPVGFGKNAEERKELIEQHNELINQRYGVNIETDPFNIRSGERSESWSDEPERWVSRFTLAGCLINSDKSSCHP